jgi:antitoxin ParD1/3/4
LLRVSIPETRRLDRTIYTDKDEQSLLSTEPAMNVSLTPQLEKMVRDKVESGLYNNASEVVREALRLMAERERHQRIARSLDHALEQYRREGGTPFSELTVEQIIADAKEAEHLDLPIDDDVTW